MITINTARAILRGIVMDLSTPRGCDVWRDIHWDYRAICLYLSCTEDDPGCRGAAMDELLAALAWRLDINTAGMPLEQVHELDDLLSEVHLFGIKACMPAAAWVAS